MGLWDEIGDELGNHFTTEELISVAELLEHGAEGCDAAAEDMAEAANFEAKHGNENSDYQYAADEYSATSGRLGELAAAIRAGEIKGREDA